MLFNSPEFLLFLPIVFGLYWFVVQRNLKAQNVLLLVASYVFYGCWDWRFLGLIAFSTVVDFMVGIRNPNVLIIASLTLVLVLVLMNSSNTGADFIYFQF